MITKIITAYIIFTALGVMWFLNRMGDKLGRNRSPVVKLLDAILITPLLPIAMLVGKYVNFRKRKN